ncbi:MAG: FHA domain-containing protein [Proteobacteria bacterium]|nr:FHA domain-containing protein [Pseudomonadota bacterium]
MTKYRIVYQNTSLEAPEGAFLVGRSAECHLVLDDPSVSRIHFAIIHEQGKLYVEDRGSRNGVLVNGTRTKERLELHDGDRIAIGHQVINIYSKNRAEDADRTVGLSICKSCGGWISSHESTCSRCGAGLEKRSSYQVKEILDDFNEDHSKPIRDSIVEPHPISMMAGLALKSIRVAKLDEAEQLVSNAINSALRKLNSRVRIEDGEFDAITDTIVALARASKSTAEVTRLFSFHRAAGRLFSRELVETLYDIVRIVGYRACPEMVRYIAFLDSKADEFTPGERFVYRRLQGLVKVCS